MMRGCGGTIGENGGALGSMPGPRAGLCLHHALLLLIVFIACLCLVSMATAQTQIQAQAQTRTRSASRVIKTGAAHAAAASVTVSDGADDDEHDEARVRAAVIEAVQARMGAAVQVTLGEPRVRSTGALPARLAAVADVGSHTGGSVRFMLFERDAAARVPATTVPARARRVGSVDVEVDVQAEQLRARGPIARGADITAADVEPAIAGVGRVPFKPLPAAGRALGARAARDIAAGQVITAALLVVSPLVQSGDEVTTRVRVGALEARGIAVAAQSGALGDEILLVNAESRRRLKGRITGKREVEVLH